MKSVYVLRVECQNDNGDSYTYEREYARSYNAYEFLKRFVPKKGFRIMRYEVVPEWRLF